MRDSGGGGHIREGLCQDARRSEQRHMLDVRSPVHRIAVVFLHHTAFMRRLRPSLLVADVFVGKVEVLLPIKFGYVMITSADVIADAAVHGLVHLRPPFRR